MGSAEIGGKIFLTTNVLLKYEKIRISVKKDDNDLMEHFFKLHSKWSQNAITVKEEVAMQYRSLEKAMKMDSTALMEHFLSLFIGENSTVKAEFPEESLDSLTSQPTQPASLGEASTPPVMEYNNASVSQDGSTSASPRNLVQSRDTALCSVSSNTAIKNSGALYMDNQGSCIPTVHIPLDSAVSLHQLSGTSSLSHTFSQKRKLSGSSDGDVPASKIPGIQHHVRHLHPSQSSGEPLQQENIPDRRPLMEGTTGHHVFGYQTGSTRNDYGKPSATFSLQDVEQQQNQGIRTSAFHSDRSKDSSRDISKTTLDFTEGVSHVTPIDSVHSLRLSVDRVGMGSTVGSETLERPNILGMSISQQSSKGLRQNRVSMDNSLNIHPQPGTSGVNQSFSGAVTEFDLSAVKIEVNSDEDLEEVSRESGDQEALAAMVTDAEKMMCRENQARISSKLSRQPSFYKGVDHPSKNQELILVLDPAARTHSHMHSMVPYTLPNQHQNVDGNGVLYLDGFLEFERDDGARTFCELLSLNRLEHSLDFSPSDDWNYFQSAQNLWSIEEKLEYLVSICHAGCRKLKKIQSAFHQGYYLYKYSERDREQCTNFIQKHMSLSQSKKLKQLYMQLGCFRTLSHCTLSIRHIVNHITHVRNLIENQSLEAKQFWKFPPSKDPYQFLQAYQEWHHLEECAVYHMGLPDNHCDVDVIKHHTIQILTNVTSDSIWKIEHFLANSAVENRYLVMIDKGNLGNCFILYRNKSGKFSLMDDRFKCLQNMESGSKIHLLTIK